ncbi:MAG: hypothetical protein Q4D59_03570 [Erysipelotrichaceae bacterium]|nr:hypothetical protein [Erysipelotrichaceae bacterium]
MTLTLGYRRNTENTKNLHGVALPALLMSGALAYSAILGGLVNYSAARDLTVSAFELSHTAEQEAAWAVPAEAKADTATILDARFPRVYLNEDAQILGSDQMLAAAIGEAGKREMVYMMGKGEEFSMVLLENGTEGYIRTSSLSGSLAEIFDACNQTKWIANDSAAILAAPAADAAVAAEALYNEEVTITGTNDLQYWQVRYGDVYGYIDHDALMDEMYVEPEPEPEPVIQAPAYTAPQANPAWNGQPLTRSAGVIYGPSGKETYYNLNMSGVIALMQAAGYNYNYWVRSDGVKMYGDYVMVACGFQVRPRGTIVESSLGTAICADTGTFSYTDPYQIDIAVDW